MTSGIFQQTPISAIWVDRAKRQRKQLPDLTELRASIAEVGLINPVVVSRDLELWAGECRWECCKALGWSHISTQFVDELDEAVLHQIELEENVKRNDLPWQDECLAVAEYHALRAAQVSDWTQEDTAVALAISPSSVIKKLSVARELRAGNKDVLDAPKYSTAHRNISRAESRKNDEALLALSARPAQAPAPDSILVADFNEWSAAYEGPRFNFIHCDFPYGIGADKFVSGGAASHGGYEDSEHGYWLLLDSLASNLNRFASESCHIMFWYSMHYHTETLKFFAERTDFVIDPFPLIWMKSDNVGILPDPERGPRRSYETCLFGSRGDRKIVRSVSNAFAAPSERDLHMSIKPAGMLGHFFRMFVDSNTLLLDPTCGSGGALRAAESMGARLIIGLERNPTFAERAQSALNRARQERGKDSTTGGGQNQVGQVEANADVP